MRWPILGLWPKKVSANEREIMQASITQSSQHAFYELRFRSLFNPGRGYTFPCNAKGIVDLDELSERERNSYFRARSTIGRDFEMPAVERGDRRSREGIARSERLSAKSEAASIASGLFAAGHSPRDLVEKERLAGELPFQHAQGLKFAA